MEHDIRTIINPFAANDDYHCFGCDPGNPIGLRLKFELDGDEVTSTWTPRPDLEGYPGVVHGGIQATLVDEIGAWYVYAVLGIAGVTKALEIQYLRPALAADGPFRLRGRGQREGQRLARIHVTMENTSGEICAEATCTYAVFSEGVSRSRFDYPGKGAFFE